MNPRQRRQPTRIAAGIYRPDIRQPLCGQPDDETEPLRAITLRPTTGAADLVHDHAILLCCTGLQVPPRYADPYSFRPNSSSAA
jgi:hypothetical protein